MNYEYGYSYWNLFWLFSWYIAWALVDGETNVSKKKIRYCSVISCGHGDINDLDVKFLAEDERIKYASKATWTGSNMSGTYVPVCDVCKDKLGDCGLTWRKI